MIVLLIIIISISLLVIYPSFNLSFFGDDWLAFFRYFQHIEPRSPGEWNLVTYFLTPYGAQDIIMGILQKVFDYQSTYYYLISYVLRVIAAISFFPLVSSLTKSRLAAFFSALFFSVTIVGFDTTNWVFNMPTYITIALFNLFLYFFILNRERKNIKLLFLSGILYYLAYVTTPIRMHGSLPFILFLELFWVFQERKANTLKKALFRFIFILVIFLVIRYTGQSQGPAEEASQRLNLGIKAMSEMLQAGRFDFIFYPILMFGSMIIPDFILSPIQILSRSKLLLSIVLPTLLGFLLFSFLLTRNTLVSKPKFFKLVLIPIFVWIIIITFTFKANLNTFNNGVFLTLALIGGFSIILVVALMIKYVKQKNISTALFLGLSWSILSFFFAWWWEPTSIFPTPYRYLIVSAAGVSILFGTIISLGRTKAHRISSFAILSVILIIHIFATHTYINALLQTRRQDISKKIWSSIPYIKEIALKEEPIVFYIAGDGTNGSIVHDAISFGLPPHLALLYNLRAEDGNFPFPVDTFNDVLALVQDGKRLPAYGYPVKPVPIDKVYAFYLQGQDNLINITDEVRKKLKDSIENGIK